MIFSQEEFNSRIAKVKQSMNKRGVDVLLTTDPSNMNYLTGYDGWSFYVPQGVIISIDEDQPFWFGRKQDSNGARITTFLNEENIEFADIGRVRFLLEKYSQYINFPLHILDGKELNDRVNEAEALWLKPKRSIKGSEYIDFYKFMSFDQDEPISWIHNKVEGKHEYTNLIYIPSKPPFDLWNRESPRGLKLYIQRVFIMDDASNFLPLYLRFLRGVIDTNDLPLNVSREILQSNPLVDTIKKSITKRSLESLKKLKDDSFDKYKEFWKEFGLVLKEGPAEDFENKELISSLMLFNSSSHDVNEFTSLDSYIEKMDDAQEHIYFCVADTIEAASNSPHIEKLKSKRHTVQVWVSKEGLVSIDDRLMNADEVSVVMYDKRVADPQIVVSLKGDEEAEMAVSYTHLTLPTKA